MKYSIIALIGIVGVTTLFASSEAELAFDNKCVVCHVKTMPTDMSSMVAPALNGVMRHIKMVYPNREEAVTFMVDYVQYPSEKKAVCMAQKIQRFGVMPSQKGNISPQELEKVVGWMYDNYPTSNFRGHGMGMKSGSKFSMLDANGDGAITKDELMKMREKKQAQRASQGIPMKNASKAPLFESIDSNGDGKITPDEFDRRQMIR